jgi:uncharacterized protein YoxC
MARQRDLLNRLADAGEEAIQRLQETPGADRLLGVAHTLRDRMDELQKKVRGIDALENRIRDLERKVDQLSGTKRTTAARKTRAKSSTKKRSSSSSRKTT